MKYPVRRVWFENKVYEVVKDTNKNTYKPLNKQTNGPWVLLGYQVERRIGESYNQIADWFENAFKEQAKQKGVHTKIMHAYPLKEDDFDKAMNFTIIYGWKIEQRKRDPNKPVVIPGELSHEEVLQARMDSLKPIELAIPFLLALPETDRYMFDYKFSYTPDTAIVEYDSSKHERDPFLDMDESIFSTDPTQHISTEDVAKAPKPTPMAAAVHEAVSETED